MAMFRTRCQRNAPTAAYAWFSSSSAFSTSSLSSSLMSLLIVLILACCCLAKGLAYANAINDVNNMLRDSNGNSNSNNKNNNNYGNGNNAIISSSTMAAAAETETDLQDNQQQQQQQHIVSRRRSINNIDENTNLIDNIGDADADAEDSSIESSELLRFVDDHSSSISNENNVATKSGSGVGAGSDDNMLPLNDQVRLLTKQLNALMLRRREDYEMLERNLRKSLKISSSTTATTTGAASIVTDMDMRSELVQLRHEIKTLRDTHLIGNKERLTLDWLTQSVAEIRKQLVELQQIASNASKDVSHRTQSYEDLATLRSDFQQVKLELVALRERQERVEVFVQELREETLQQEEDYKRLLHNSNKHSKHKDILQSDAEGGGVEDGEMDEEQQRLDSVEHDGSSSGSSSKDIKLSTAIMADHKRRHCRFQRQQIHELQLAQHDLKRQLTELKYHRIGERVRTIEIEQHRIADANFNLSRQIASLDKLHSSMLELLEDVEGLQSKMDKSIPELRHEISKLEFSNAQLNSEQSLVREEGKNVARSVQAMAVSVSALQDEREGVRSMESSVRQLQQQFGRLQSIVEDVQRAMMHHQRRAQRLENHTNQPHHQHHGHSQNHNSNATTSLPTQNAENLVTKLENVELQYESIINRLPHDCSEVSIANNNDATNGGGLFLIAPAGQHHPLMAHCAADGWMTVQRRYDGSADFNRSWEDYATGFGSPAGEYWIGNEQLHALTQNNCTALRVQMTDIYDNVWLAEYARFQVSSRADGYRLHIAGYCGNASDALDYQQGMQFSAIDVDRDISQTHCAANYEGGWWFSHCQHANLNGRYNLGLTWFDASRNEWIAVKSSQMLIRRLPAVACAYDDNTRTMATPETVTIVASESATMATATTTATLSASATTLQQQAALSSATRDSDVVVFDDVANVEKKTLASVRTTTTITAVV